MSSVDLTRKDFVEEMVFPQVWSSTQTSVDVYIDPKSDLGKILQLLSVSDGKNHNNQGDAEA